MIATARRRAQTARLDNIIFQETALESFEGNSAFDCVVGRYVLIHQNDPVAFLRAATRCVKDGGILALHEIDVRRMSPWYAPLWPSNTANALATSASRDRIAHYDAGTRLFEHFFNAGLPKPTMDLVADEAPIAATLENDANPSRRKRTANSTAPRRCAPGCAYG